MAKTTEGAKDRGTTAGLARQRGGALLLVAAYGVAVLLALRTFDLGINLGDEGVAAMGAWRISGGEVPHRDFFEIIPPGSFLPTALAMRVLGPGVLALRLTALLLQLALLVAADLSLRALSSKAFPRAALLLFLGGFGVPLWNMPSHHWFVDAAHLGAIACLAAGLRGRPRLWGFFGGGLCAYGVFCLQDQGGIFVIALVLGFLPWVEKGTARTEMTLAWAVGLAAGTGPFLLWLLPQVSPRALFTQWIGHALAHYRSLPGHHTGLFGGFDELVELTTSGGWGRAPFFAGAYFVGALFIFLLPFLALFIAALAWRRRWAPRAVVGLYGAGCVAAVAAAARRWSLRNLDWAAPVLAVVLLWGLGRLLSDSRRAVRIAGWCSVGLLTASFGIYDASMIVAGGRADLPALVSSAGKLRSLYPGEIPPVQGLLDAVETAVPPNAPLFCRGFLPMVNFLTLRPNPTRYNLFVGGYSTPEQAAEVVGDLEARRVNFVVTEPGLDPASPLDLYLRENFRPVWRNGAYILAARKGVEVRGEPGLAPPSSP